MGRRGALQDERDGARRADGIAFVLPMSHTPGPLTRLVRACTALVTVWCLGCCGYEPVLEAMLGAEAGSIMQCGRDDGLAQPADVSAARTAGSGMMVATVVHPAGSPASACGCQNCNAPTPVPAVLGLLPAPEPGATAMEASSLPSVARSPLVPPPQLFSSRA